MTDYCFISHSGTDVVDFEHIIASYIGMVKSVSQLFEELVKCDEERLLKDVSAVIEAK